MRIYSPNFYFDELTSENERGAYYSISAAAQNRGQCTVFHGDIEATMRAWHAYVLDTPGTFSYPGLFARFTSDGHSTSVDMKYSACDEALCREKMNEVIRLIEQKCPLGTSAYKTAKTIYEYLSKNVKYDFDVFEEYIAVASMPEDTEADRERKQQREIEMLRDNSNAFTAVGVFVDKKAVCMGLSKAYKLLCEEFGIPCICVEARSNDDNGCEHMLNIIEIDGVCSFVDTTKGIFHEDLLMYNYDMFLATTRTAELFYTFEREFDCNDESQSYHARRNIVFKNLNDLRSYLLGFDMRAQKYSLRFRYRGTLLDDGELWGWTRDIIRSALPRGASLSGNVDHGFFNGMVIKN